MSNITGLCGGGWFAYPLDQCAPCPPHTIGLDGVNCVRCPEDMYATGLGNIACSPCLNSNYTLDPTACPVLVPAYYYTAASSAGISVLLLFLLIAAVCVVQKRSQTIRQLQLKDQMARLMRRLATTNNEEAAEEISYQAVDGMLVEHDEDVDSRQQQPRMIAAEDDPSSMYVVDEDGDIERMPEDSVVDFSRTGDLEHAIVTITAPPPPPLAAGGPSTSTPGS